jgi:hypothetical protein
MREERKSVIMRGMRSLVYSANAAVDGIWTSAPPLLDILVNIYSIIKRGCHHNGYVDVEVTSLVAVALLPSAAVLRIVVVGCNLVAALFCP